MDQYELARGLHLIATVFFVGNLIVTLFGKALADLTNDPVTIAFAQRLTAATDWVFTATGLLTLVITGIVLVTAGDAGMQTLWLRMGAGLTAAAAAVWLAGVIPLQTAQGRMARAFARSRAIPGEYWELATWWYASRSLVAVLALLAFALMVIRPE